MKDIQNTYRLWMHNTLDFYVERQQLKKSNPDNTTVKF